VTIERMTPLGKLTNAEAVEAGFSLLATLIAVGANDPAANDLYRNAEDPQLVHGVSKGLIEKDFSDAIRQLVLDHRTAVPGVDLARVLGLGG